MCTQGEGTRLLRVLQQGRWSVLYARSQSEWGLQGTDEYEWKPHWYRPKDCADRQEFPDTSATAWIPSYQKNTLTATEWR